MVFFVWFFIIALATLPLISYFGVYGAIASVMLMIIWWACLFIAIIDGITRRRPPDPKD